MRPLLPILCLVLVSCSPKGQAIKDLTLSRRELTNQHDLLESASVNLDTASNAILVGSPPEEVASHIATAQDQVQQADQIAQDLVVTIDRTIQNVSDLRDPEPKWLAALRYGAIILGSILVGYVLFRFIGPILGPILAHIPFLIPQPKRDAATIAAKVSGGDLSAEALITAIRSDPTANAVYKRAKKKGQ